MTVRRNGTLIARYAYDVLGRRIVKRVYSTASGGTLGYLRMVYRGSHVGFETDSAGTIGLTYTWGAGTDQLLAITDGATHYYATTDRLGSVRSLAKRDGTWALTQRFSPYGVRMSRDTSASYGLGSRLRYGWIGREFDAETGLSHHRARYLLSTIRRWTQEDPIGYQGGLNVYQYASGSPLELVDRNGLESEPLDIKVGLFYVQAEPVTQVQGCVDQLIPQDEHLCIDFFIHTASSMGLRGDNRGYGEKGSSRVVVIIHVTSGTVTTQLNESCLIVGICDNEHRNPQITVTTDGTGDYYRVQVNVGAGVLPFNYTAPRIDARIDLFRQDDGSFISNGMRNNYPALGVYHWQDGVSSVVTERPLPGRAGAFALWDPLYLADQWCHTCLKEMW